jgi:hypothetical protein
MKDGASYAIHALRPEINIPELENFPFQRTIRPNCEEYLLKMSP